MMFTPLTIKRTVAVLHLTRGLHAYVDSDTWPVVGLHQWNAHSNSRGYVRVESGTRFSLASLICPCPPSMMPDHINGNVFDNRRQNLRPATCQQNAQNCKAKRGGSGFKGVYKSGNRFRAIISRGDLRRHIGNFDTPEDAARAYDAAAIELFGNFARTNFTGAKP